MHEDAAVPINIQASGVPVGPAIPDAQHEVRGEHGGVAVPVRGLQPDHPGHHRHAQDLGEIDEQIGGVGVDDPATGHQQRSVRRAEHLDGLFRLLAGGGRPGDRQWLIGLDVELDLRQLDVDRQIEQYRSGPTGACPETTSSGTESAQAEYRPVMVSVPPGPLVTRHRPMLPAVALL